MESLFSVCPGSTVLLAGCGGGYDVFGAVLLYQRIKSVAKNVVLLNFSFTAESTLQQTAELVAPRVYCVAPRTIPTHYYPEAHLATHLSTPVYALSTSASISDIVEAYRAIAAREGTLDVHVLVDGGCDVLLRGTEIGLATPVEDMMHLTAAIALPTPHKFIAAIGANVDMAHGVVQRDLDERLAELKRSGIQLGDVLLRKDLPEAAFYCDIVMKSCPVNSIVQSLVVAAIHGQRGLYTPPHLKARIGASTVPLTDQTCTLFLFDMVSVARQVVYLDQLQTNMTRNDVSTVVRNHLSTRNIPKKSDAVKPSKNCGVC